MEKVEDRVYMQVSAQWLQEEFKYKANSWNSRFSETYKKVKNKPGRENVYIYHETVNGERHYYINVDYKEKAAPKTMFELPLQETRRLSFESLHFVAFEQVVLLGVLFQSGDAFHGNYNKFLEYVGITNRTENVKRLKEAIDFLVSKDILIFTPDDSAPGWFVMAVKRSFQEEIGITMERVDECRKIADNAGLAGYKGWNDVLKIWLAIEFLSQGYQGEDTYITNGMIEDATGLDEKRIIQVKKALINSNKLLGDKGFRVNKNGDLRCMGTTYKLNIIEEGNGEVSQGTFDF